MAIFRQLQVLITCSVISAAICSACFAADSKWAGFLVDRSCANNCKAQGYGEEFLRSHKKECALNENCSREGYTLFSKGQWYPLDKRGSELAKQLIQSSATKEGHYVVVSGSAEKGQLKVTTIKELAPQQ